MCLAPRIVHFASRLPACYPWGDGAGVRTSNLSLPSRLSSTQMAELLVAALQTPTSSPAARASSISLITPSRAGTFPLAAHAQALRFHGQEASLASGQAITQCAVGVIDFGLTARKLSAMLSERSSQISDWHKRDCSCLGIRFCGSVRSFWTCCRRWGGALTYNLLILKCLPVLQRINQLRLLIICLWDPVQDAGCGPPKLTCNACHRQAQYI